MNEDDYYDLNGGNFRVRDIKRAYDLSNVWTDEMYDARNLMAAKYEHQSEKEVLRQLKKLINEPKTKTKEDRVIDIIHGGFERHFNMSINEFQAIYEQMLETSPEALV